MKSIHNRIEREYDLTYDASALQVSERIRCNILPDFVGRGVARRSLDIWEFIKDDLDAELP